ncbi:hypothetical protein V494_07030 [Pseudogymnoascus sp. VKM F-4513 (FW-928)]|nr:hypothetical protein V494_07030 [Pseudogymnoascus sp. VKM F-4513 (FW-928)]
MLIISLAVALLAPLTLAKENPADHKNDIYLARMCYPQLHDPNSNGNWLSKVANSPFPCEQQAYLHSACYSNGTTEIDFLAEQQCLCGGNYFEAARGCQECYYAHGNVVPGDTLEKALSRLKDSSSAECSATPVTVPYTNLYSVATTLGPDATIISDRFPNNTAVTNYWTGAATPIAGKITGSATGRLTTVTNTDGARYTPTGTTTSPSSTNGAAEVTAAGGLLAVVIGVVAVL